MFRERFGIRPKITWNAWMECNQQRVKWNHQRRSPTWIHITKLICCPCHIILLFWNFDNPKTGLFVIWNKTKSLVSLGVRKGPIFEDDLGYSTSTSNISVILGTGSRICLHICPLQIPTNFKVLQILPVSSFPRFPTNWKFQFFLKLLNSTFLFLFLLQISEVLQSQSVWALLQ